MNKKNIFLILFISIIISCSNNENKNNLANPDTAIVSMDSFPENTIQIQESKNVEDTLLNDGSSYRLKPIRDNFKRLNSTTNWSSIEEKFYEASIEGGTAKFYYQNKKLQKIITVSFGETYRSLIEYYLLDGELSFVYEKTFRYNRPFNYDSTSMKENNDTEVFDLSKATLKEVRNYFENDKLIYQISKDKKDNNLNSEYKLSEQKRIIDEYEKLLKFAMEP